MSNFDTQHKLTYRHIFFKKNIMQSGSGNTDVCYYGQLYSNCDKMKNWKDIYDYRLDLYVACDACAKQKYRHFIKINKRN